MAPVAHFPPFDGRRMRDAKDDGAPRGDGGAFMAEVVLDQELLGTLCRRSRRRLRDIQSSCEVVMKLDRVRGALRMWGSEASIEAAQKQLASLGGPRKQVSPALWAELMRTRTLQTSSQAIVLHLQEISGCRIHIERSRHEVRIFGPQPGIVLADRLLEELSKQCDEETIPATTNLLGMPALQDLAHALGVTLRLEDNCIIVLGLEDRVKIASQELHKFVADPSRYTLQLSQGECKLISAAWPTLSTEGMDLSDMGSTGYGSTAHSSNPGSATASGDLAPMATAPAAGLHREAPQRWAMKPQPLVAARQAQAFEQLRGPQAGNQQMQGNSMCPTCGVGRFCLFCGEPTWVNYNNCGGYDAGSAEHGSHRCGPDAGVAKPKKGRGGQGRPWQAPGEAAAPQSRAQLYFGETPTSGSARPAASPAALQSGDHRQPALDASRCMVPAGAGGMVMAGGMVPMCFPMQAPDQTSPVSWITGGIPVMSQNYADTTGSNGGPLMRHVYMVPAYAQPGMDE